MLTVTGAKFELGELIITVQAFNSLIWEDVENAISRHAKGDWGDLDDEDRQSNDDALTGEGRLLSAYVDRKGTRFWIITEWDRSLTTVLLPCDY